MLTGTVFVIGILLALLSLALPDRTAAWTIATAAVCLAAVLATIEAGRARRYVWAMGLLGLAAILNPLLPLLLSPTGAVLLLSAGFAILTGWMFARHHPVPSA